MSSVSAYASPPSLRGLRWWQWLVFIAPTFVSVGTAWALLAIVRARGEASGTDPDTYWALFYAGVTGAKAGAICCLLCGIILGWTTRARDRWIWAMGWTLLSAMTNAVLSFGGCSLVDLWDRPHREKMPVPQTRPHL